MTITFQYVKIQESDTLSAATIEHLNKLNKKYPELIRAQVYFKVENTSAAAHQICEIEISAPGPRLFATTTAVHFETAMKETISDLNKQLSKRKAILKAH
ncbi:putative sigma-54 modulation protein [Dokdonia sp. Hel_I_63]|uniref:HPF/RaiA family ribosome-associated protein n=1 Tax=unclassified Dokdonia TaxID=2615033 RepID=UPI00020A734B|nr:MULTISPECIES: HPF/RaiA family ribosome-associated protein [unclassified Dokdonia]AEE20319.1 site-specific recombinase, phage integrase family/ribosomal subunitinterface protein [Dokdonia sp. 4H-3-7-5]TVZ23418.1 putative sigma-54 modulation protein [Dokdonia sp. Hel_I_63]